MASRKAILVGISGVSSSGKTTLARLLRDIFPRTFILHEDDFYKTDTDIPVKDGISDWDCLEAIDLPAFEEALAHIKANGCSPPDFTSKEDENSIGEVEVDAALVQRLTERAQRVLKTVQTSIAIIDGFLLFSEDMKPIRDLFDIKIFLRTDYMTAKSRREARSGYVTLEGFWEDPPGYVDKIVWPNYVHDHRFLFVGGDVEGELDQSVIRGLHLDAVPKEAQKDMSKCLEWVYEVLERRIEELSPSVGL